MPYEKDDKPDSLDRVRGDRSLARRSGFMARRVRELAQKARELKLADEIEVVFPDKVLEAAVRVELGKPDDPITRGVLKGLTRMSGMLGAASTITPPPAPRCHTIPLFAAESAQRGVFVYRVAGAGLWVQSWIPPTPIP